MRTTEVLQFAGHIAAAIAVIWVVAHASRKLAALLLQPPVIGEITTGLLAGPALISLFGPDAFGTILPPDVLTGLHEVGNAGLVLFLVGIAHHLLFGRAEGSPRGIGWTMAGAVLVPAVLGGALALWLLLSGDAHLRGTTSTPAFVLMVVVALSVTAVPVLARILAERRLDGSLVGRLSMAAAVVIDMVAWLLLGLALSLHKGGVGAAVLSMVVLVCGFGVAMAVRRLLRGRPAAFAGRFPEPAAVLVGVAAIATAALTSHVGLTEVIGAVLAGLALPREKHWTRVVRRVSWAGRAFVPVFFVLAGIEVFTKPMTRFPWLVFVVATALAVVGKIGGGYLGARLGGQPKRTAVVTGVLLNTRGLTEIVVLQAGYAAGILTPSLLLALLAMALVTTAMTGPLLTLLGVKPDGTPPAETPDLSRTAREH